MLLNNYRCTIIYTTRILYQSNTLVGLQIVSNNDIMILRHEIEIKLSKMINKCYSSVFVKVIMILENLKFDFFIRA